MYDKSTRFFTDGDIEIDEELELELDFGEEIELDDDFEFEQEPEQELEQEPEQAPEPEIEIEDDDDFIESFGELYDNVAEIEMVGIGHDEYSENLAGEEYKQYVINQIELEIEAERAYLQSVLGVKYKSQEHVYDRMRRDSVMLNPESSMDGVFGADDYVVWSRNRREDILDKEKDVSTAISFMNDLFRAHPDRVEGFSLPVTEAKLYSSATLMKIYQRLVKSFEVTRKTEEDSIRAKQNNTVKKLEEEKELDSRLESKISMVESMKSSKVYPIKGVSYEAKVVTTVERDGSKSGGEENISFTCGSCGGVSNSEHMFNQVNIYNQSCAKKTFSHKEERYAINSVVNVFIGVSKCDSCGAYGALPVLAFEDLKNAIKRFNATNSYSLDLGVTTRLNQVKISPDMLEEVYSRYIDFKYDFKGREVVDNASVTLVDLEESYNELREEFNGKIQRFKVGDRLKNDEDFQRFSLLKYVTSSSSRGSYGKKEYVDLASKTLNAICSTLYFTTAKVKADGIEKEIDKCLEVVHDFEHIDNIVNNVIPNCNDGFMMEFTLDSFNDYSQRVCGESIFEDNEGFADRKVSDRLMIKLDSIRNGEYREASDKLRRLREDLASLKKKVRNPDIYKYLVVNDFSTTPSKDFMEFLGDNVETREFFNEVFNGVVENLCQSVSLEYLMGKTGYRRTVINAVHKNMGDGFPKIMNKLLSSGELGSSTGESKDLVSTIDEGELGVMPVYDVVELCSALTYKNYTRVMREYPEALEGAEVHQYEKDYKGKMAEIMLEFDGVGFSEEELEKYFIEEGNKLPEVANYVLRKEGEDLASYISNLGNRKGRTVVKKPYDDLFVKAYLDNPEFERNRLRDGYFRTYMKKGESEFDLTSRFARLINVGADWAIKSGLMMIDEELIRTMCKDDLDFNPVDEIDMVLSKAVSGKESIYEYFRNVNLLCEPKDLALEFGRSGLLDSYTDIVESMEDNIREGNTTGMDSYLKFANQVMGQLPENIVEEYSTEISVVKSIVETRAQ